MGVNVGAFLAPLLCGYLGDTGDPADFKWGFFAAAIVMIFSLLVYATLKNKYLIGPAGTAIGIDASMKEEQKRKELAGTPKNTEKIDWKQLTLWIVIGVALFALFMRWFNNDFFGAIIYSACIVIPGFVISDKSLTKIERQRIWVIYIIAFFVIFFWAAFEQAGISLTFFAEEQTNRSLFGWTMPASWFQSFNAVFVVLLAPLFSTLWLRLGQKNMEPASPTKQAIGLLLLSLGYLLIAFGVKGVAPGMKVSMMWLVGLYFIHTMGELTLSPIGLSMVNKLSPARFASLLMGVWYLSMATSNKLAAALSSFYPEPGKNKELLGFEISTMFDFFMIFVVMAAVASVLLFFLSKRLQKLMHGIR